MNVCTLCPRCCGAERGTTGGSGYCRMGSLATIARAALHFDEEPVISGTRGSGTIFFSGCSLGCVYCQNEAISRGGAGVQVSPAGLRRSIDALIAQGAHNINLVTAGHFLDAVIEALTPKPDIPVVWNSSGYETADAIRRLDGYVDIYLPDLKYSDARGARQYSNAPDYPDVAGAAIAEMRRQVGPAIIGADGVMRRGLMIRHMILPGRARESEAALTWIRDHLPDDVWVSLMAQYVPTESAARMPPLDRRISRREYDRVADHMLSLGFENGYIQERTAARQGYVPAFDMTGVYYE